MWPCPSDLCLCNCTLSVKVQHAFKSNLQHSSIPRESEMLRFKSSDTHDSANSAPRRGCFFLFVSLLYCSTYSHARILCAATPSGGLISEQKPYTAFRFALFMALLFPSELIHSSLLVVWGYLGWPILCLMSSETKISIFGHRMMIFIIGRDQWPEW